MKGDVQISKELNRKVDKFIENLSSNLSEDKETIRDFRDEMKVNFTASIIELLKEGHSESEAFDIAETKFGDADNLKEDLSGAFKVRNRGNKISFFIAAISLLISISCFAYYEKVDAVRNEAFPNDLQNELSLKLQEGSAVNQDKVEELMKNHKKELKLVALYKEENNRMVLKNLYPSDFDKSKIDKALYQFRSSEYSFQNHNKEQYEMKIVTTENRYSSY
ncbi:hypothetical protein JHL18_11335 [Clostridium sp. YIM B02505]|uniref:Anti sigma-E protein RseA N-terminal domain-containing protein n=1 Tax=Clostridium yunnanense TaxID=2800325 RepID=A0ABS1EPA7_9CLOT|nr:permease prefix domain 1-containing protein [Clostridium yunnanense]MBK1811224.1 hypothetical protein [Clostridium yunnanense]